MADREQETGRSTSPHSGLRRATTERAILDCLAAEDGPLTRAELSRRTAISPPAISEAVRRLEADQILVAVGPRSGVPGAVATLYDLAPGAGVVVAVEINRRVVRTAVGDLAGRSLERADHDPPDDGRVAPRLHEVLATLSERWRADGRPVRAVAVSIANPVDPATGRVVELHESAFPAGVVGVEDVHDVDPSMVVLDNDVNFAALAERDHGAAVGTATFAYLYVGERHSVGLGLVVDGVLVRGARGLAGEIGYLPLGEGSGRFRFGDAVAAQALTTGGTVDDATLQRAGRTLGEAAVAVCACVDPALLVLGGPVGLIPGLRPHVEATVAELAPREVPVVAGALGETAPLWGALAEARRRAWESLVSGR
ncbi:putative NBD/HSP70 family sugar kinase [Actinomycetospora succinea]|uniref:Putative NBD/HSP70 family sugar kinase n=1 Tax=Actinomycetospora succinea TaxID=663603 RepID=A0A4R6VD19_9PSEU|nr:ROK family transcriptional regulator [Actinomycetospora succinea]TDQ60632.1 putative NBD/HSP70 family sugar kinase [Actinomycetospora succinea]